MTNDTPPYDILDLGSHAGDDDTLDMHPDAIDLEKIPQRLWKQTLAPHHRSQRGFIARRIRDERSREIANEIAFELDVEECERAFARQEARGRALRTTAGTLPSPDAAHGMTQPTVQINVRLRPDDHERLKQAAVAVGMRPTTLARALMLNGVAQMLRERAT